MKSGLIVWANLTIGLVVLLAGLRVYQDYRDTMAETFFRLENLARIADEQVSGSLKAVDVLLKDVAQEARSVASESDERALIANMKMRSVALEELRTLYVTDGNGRVGASTLEQLKGFDASQRPYYTMPQRSTDHDCVFVSGPLQASLNRDWVLFLSRARPVETPGAWAGVTVASLSPPYFTRILDSMVPRVEGFAEIVTRAGDIVARSPSQEHFYGQNISNPSFAAYLASGARSHHLVKKTVSEGIRRLMVYRVTSYPDLVIIISQSESVVLAAWYRKAALTVMVQVLLILVAVFTMRRFAAHERNLRDSRERLRLLFDANSDAVFVAGVDASGVMGRIEEVNATACRTLGYTREELLRLTPFDVDPNLRHDAPTVMASLLAGGSPLFERIQVAKDGRHIPVELRAHMLEMAGRPMVLAVARDITVRRQTEQQLRAAEEKSRELSELNQKIRLK